MEPVSVVLRRDAWLESFLRKPAYGLALKPAADAGPVAASGEDLRRALPPGPLFAFAKIPAGDVAAASLLEDAGFRLAETGLVFEKRLGPGDRAAPAQRVRFARPQDEARVREIAGGAFSQSRFHLDPGIPREAADALKAAWAGNFFSGGRGDAMVVAEEDGTVAGFLLLLVAADVLVVDLVAVDAAWRGRGLAKAMLLFAGASGPFRLYRVGTQASNPAAMALYASLGFRPARASHVFHYHGA